MYLDKIIDIPTDLDTTLNLKINSKLKKEFEKLCKQNHSNVSREIKGFMSQCVKQGRIIDLNYPHF